MLHVTPIVSLLAVVCVVIIGCRAPGAQPSGHRSAGAIAIGMPMSDALALLRRNGIAAAPNEGAYDSPHSRRHSRYLIMTPASDHGVFIIFEEPPDDGEYRVEDIY